MVLRAFSGFMLITGKDLGFNLPMVNVFRKRLIYDPTSYVRLLLRPPEYFIDSEPVPVRVLATR
jgi:hypothetical protein